MTVQSNNETLRDHLQYGFKVQKKLKSCDFHHILIVELVQLYNGKIVKCSALKEDINLNNPKSPILEKKMASMEVDYAKATKLLENAA